MWMLWWHRYLQLQVFVLSSNISVNRWKCHVSNSLAPELRSWLQVNAYAAAHGIQYGMISNILWSWAFVMDGTNSMQISQPLRYDATHPTVLRVCLYKLM